MINNVLGQVGCLLSYLLYIAGMCEMSHKENQNSIASRNTVIEKHGRTVDGLI